MVFCPVMNLNSVNNVPLQHCQEYNCIVVTLIIFRADVLISQPVEKLWRTRRFEGIEDVKWTYVGMRSGVFRTYPGTQINKSL